MVFSDWADAVLCVILDQRFSWTVYSAGNIYLLSCYSSCSIYYYYYYYYYYGHQMLPVMTANGDTNSNNRLFVKLAVLAVVNKCISQSTSLTLYRQTCQLVTLCHPGLTYIFNFWHSDTLAQSAWMSEIKNIVWPGWQSVTSWQLCPLNG